MIVARAKQGIESKEKQVILSARLVSSQIVKQTDSQTDRQGSISTPMISKKAVLKKSTLDKNKTTDITKLLAELRRPE